MSASDHLGQQFGRLPARQFVMPVSDVLDMPSAEGAGIGSGRVRDVLPMKHEENHRQLSEGEPFAVRRQQAVQQGSYKALRVSAKGELRDGHHTLAMITEAGHDTVRLQGAWRPWDGKHEDEYDRSYELTQRARQGQEG
jgi:hypothetical protein